MGSLLFASPLIVFLGTKKIISFAFCKVVLIMPTTPLLGFIWNTMRYQQRTKPSLKSFIPHPSLRYQ